MDHSCSAGTRIETHEIFISNLGSLLLSGGRCSALGLLSPQTKDLVLHHLAVGLVRGGEVGDHPVLQELLRVHQIACDVVGQPLLGVALQHAAEELSALAEVVFVSSFVSGHVTTARLLVPTRRSRRAGATEPVWQTDKDKR